MDDVSEMDLDSAKQLESDSLNGEKQSLQAQYQSALLQTGISAANLLGELIALKLMPDPRAQEMAEVALRIITIISSVTKKGGDAM